MNKNQDSPLENTSETKQDPSLEITSKDTPSVRRALGSMVLLVGIVGFSAVGGYLLGQPGAIGHFERVAVSSGLPGIPVVTRPKAIEIEPIPVADAQIVALVRQNALTDQLGQMRAELLRLQTLYVRLAKQTQLTDGEFDLESPLFNWQDQSAIQKIGLLNLRLDHMSDSSDQLASIIDQRHVAYQQQISGRPVAEGNRTSGFGVRTDPITGEQDQHKGLDFSGPVGEPVLALADGVVVFSGKNAGYGNIVELEHVDGFETRYAHNQNNIVKRGDHVLKGQAIATLGSTGRSTGPHVHIEVRRDGTAIDPALFIR